MYSSPRSPPKADTQAAADIVLAARAVLETSSRHVRWRWRYCAKKGCLVFCPRPSNLDRERANVLHAPFTAHADFSASRLNKEPLGCDQCSRTRPNEAFLLQSHVSLALVPPGVMMQALISQAVPHIDVACPYCSRRWFSAGSSLAAHVDKETVFKFPEIGPLGCGPDAPLVQCRDVYFAFPSNFQQQQRGSSVTSVESNAKHPRAKRSHLLEGVTLELTLRSRVVLVGRNGSGKSTLLRLIASACGADADAVDDSREALEPRAGDIIRHHHARVGLFTQVGRLRRLRWTACNVARLCKLACELIADDRGARTGVTVSSGQRADKGKYACGHKLTHLSSPTLNWVD